jgi:hypothetical protein
MEAIMEMIMERVMERVEGMNKVGTRGRTIMLRIFGEMVSSRTFLMFETCMRIRSNRDLFLGKRSVVR